MRRSWYSVAPFCFGSLSEHASRGELVGLWYKLSCILVYGPPHYCPLNRVPAPEAGQFPYVALRDRLPISANVGLSMEPNQWHRHQPQPKTRIPPPPAMETPDQIEAPKLVRVRRIAILEEFGDQLDDAALSGCRANDSARTCDAVTLTDRMCMGLLLTD